MTKVFLGLIYSVTRHCPHFLFVQNKIPVIVNKTVKATLYEKKATSSFMGELHMSFRPHRECTEEEYDYEL